MTVTIRTRTGETEIETETAVTIEMETAETGEIEVGTGTTGGVETEAIGGLVVGATVVIVTEELEIKLCCPRIPVTKLDYVGHYLFQILFLIIFFAFQRDLILCLALFKRDVTFPRHFRYDESVEIKNHLVSSYLRTLSCSLYCIEIEDYKMQAAIKHTDDFHNKIE